MNILTLEEQFELERKNAENKEERVGTYTKVISLSECNEKGGEVAFTTVFPKS